MTDLWGVKVGRQRQKRIPCGNGNKKQKQGQPQVLRLRCAPLRMTDLWGGVKVGRQRQKRIPCGNDNKKAKARATAGPSATLRSAQDDRFVGGESRKAKAKADSFLGMAERRQRQVQPQVLRLRCASLRMTDLWGGVKVGRQRQKRIPCGNDNKKQKQVQPQVLRLRCAPLRMTDLWGGESRKAKAKADSLRE